jgi:hypothetical protein
MRFVYSKKPNQKKWNSNNAENNKEFHALLLAHRDKPNADRKRDHRKTSAEDKNMKKVRPAFQDRP